MTSRLWGQQEMNALITESDVLDGVLECFRRIWGTEDAFDDKYIADKEYRTRLLEQEIIRQYPELYTEIIAQMGDHPLMKLENGCGVIMDALSIREGIKLAEDLTAETDWEVGLSWTPAETAPTDTEFIAGEWFGANGGKQASQRHDNVAYIGEPEVPQLPNQSLEYVWSRFPDKRLHGSHQGQYTLTELDDIYQETKQILLDIISESSHSKFLVSSDHGYVNFNGNNPYTLTEKQESVLKNKFDGRYIEVTNSGVLRELEQQDITIRTHGYYMVQGHYHWKTPNEITHGGFSLPEVMTPLLKIETGGAN